MDKLLHLIIGMAIAANPLQTAEAAVATAVLVGIAKEVYDQKHKTRHTPDPKDAASTAAGALIVFAYRVEW